MTSTLPVCRHRGTRPPAARRHAQGDVRRYEDCERMVATALARYGRLDILVNCAGGWMMVA